MHLFFYRLTKRHTLSFILLQLLLLPKVLFSQEEVVSTVPNLVTEEIHAESVSIFGRMLDAGPMVSMVLLILVSMSVLTWAVFVSKWIYLRRMEQQSDVFIKKFWDSRSLNDLNGRLAEYSYSPIREVFRNGYAELVRGSQMKENAIASDIAINAALDNLSRTLHKAKQIEKRQLERFLSLLAISASVCPFIGLFGTVWGIMTAFEGIAQTGSSSLAAVAPGISEALIATAFGLAAAIPAVIGYNVSTNKIRGLLSHMDGFGYDFLNIVERYLITDRSKQQPSPPSADQSLGI